MFKRILVCGAGAIGGTIAAFLRRAGHPVSVVDVVAEHVAAIKEAGLTISGPVTEFNIACPAYLPTELQGDFDLILLAVKAQHTRSAAEMMKPYLAEDGVMVSLQNGLNEPVIAECVGASRTMGCFINFGADYLKPGQIEFGGRGPLVLGEIDGRMTARLAEVHRILQDFEPNAAASDNIFGFLWSKLAFGALLISQTLSNRPTEEFLDAPKFRPLICNTVGDVARVAAAQGIRLMSFQGFDAAHFLTGDVALMNKAISDYADSRRGSTKLYSGIWRDLAIRKRKTEMVYQYGPILDLARKQKIAIPALEAAIGMIAAVEDGHRPLEEGLADELLAQIASRETTPA